MAKRKNKTTTSNIVLPDSISAGELQNIITTALISYEESKKQKEIVTSEQEGQKWQKLTGYKDYTNKCLVIRKLMSFFQLLFLYFNIKK